MRKFSSSGNVTASVGNLGATVENGFLIFRTTHFSYYVIAGTGDSVTLDTKSYQMPVGGVIESVYS